MRTRMKAGGGSISDVRKTLNEAQDLYLNLMQHGNYTPGQQPVHDDARSRLHAMQAQVKALTDKVGSLSHDPNATSTQGNGGSTRRSRQRKDTDKTSPSDPTPLKDRDPSAMHKNGLTNAENVIANDLIKEKLKTMPDLPTIPEDADYSIIHEGKTLAQWCTKCQRFVKGKNKHTTSEHTGRDYRPAGAYLTQQRSEDSPASPAPPSQAPSVTFQEPVSYAFDDSPPLHRGSGFLAHADTDEDSVVSCDDTNGENLPALGEIDPGLLALLAAVVLPKASSR